MDYAMSEGEVLPGRQVARVVESRNSDYSKGKVRQFHGTATGAFRKK